MIVLDTNVLIPLFVDTATAPAARRAIRLFDDWIVPVQWRAEFRSVLLDFIRSGKLAQAEAEAAFRKAEQFLEGCELEPDYRQVFTLAQKYSVSSYDVEFLALAREYECLLLTGDYKSLANKVPEEFCIRLSSYQT